MSGTLRREIAKLRADAEAVKVARHGSPLSQLLRAAMVEALAGDRIRMATPGWVAELERVNPADAKRLQGRSEDQYFDITVAEVDAEHARLLAAGWVPEPPEPAEVWKARLAEVLFGGGGTV